MSVLPHLKTVHMMLLPDASLEMMHIISEKPVKMLT